MTFAVVHKEPLYRCFRAPVTSSAFYVKILFQIIELLLPLIIIFSTQGLWKKTGEFRETPQISYNGRYIMVLNGRNNEMGLTSSFSPLNLAEDNRLFLTEENWQWISQNQFNLTYSISLKENFTVDSLTYIIFFQYGLHYHSLVEAEVALTDTVSLLGNTQSLIISGVMKTEQSKPFGDTKEIKIMDNKRQDFEHYKLGGVLSRITSADLAVFISRKNEVKIQRLNSSSFFRVSFTIGIIQDNFYYYVDHWEMLKGAWIQYLAIYYIVRRICRSILKNFFENSPLSPFISEKSY